MADFIVVKALSSYNTILGRPTLNSLKAMMSIYHLKMKFPNAMGVEEVRGEQVLARECYMQELKSAEGGIHVVEVLDIDHILPLPPEYATSEEMVKD